MTHDGITRDKIALQNREMKALSTGERAAAIASSPNVIGFERFCAIARQVQVRDAYRRGQSGKDAR